MIRYSEIVNKNKILQGDYIGIVVFNEDPKKIGRVKVEIPELLEGEVENLPFVLPKVFSPNPEGTSLNVPEVGSKIWIEFLNGDIYLPFYKAFYNSELTYLSSPKGGIDEFQEKYPNVYGYLDSTGTYVKIDKENRFMEIQHTSGIKISFNKKGELEIFSPNKVKVKGEQQIDVESPKVKVNGQNILVDSSSNIKLISPISSTLFASNNLSSLDPELLSLNPITNSAVLSSFPCFITGIPHYLPSPNFNSSTVLLE